MGLVHELPGCSPLHHAFRYNEHERVALCSFLAGAGPYKTWEKQPLCDEQGEASTSSGNEYYHQDKEHRRHSVVDKRTLRYLAWLNAAIFVLVVVGGTLLVRLPSDTLQFAFAYCITLWIVLSREATLICKPCSATD